MSVESFLQHVKAASPTFHCYACGDRSQSLALVAPLSHTLGPPADLTAIQLLQTYLGPQADSFVDLYSQHDGFTLYRDRHGDAEGLRFFPVEQWERLTQAMKESLSDMGLEPEEWPVAAIDSLAFGEIPHSGNYLTVKISGPNRGQICYADHDDFTEEAFAKSLDELLARIVEDPAQFLYDVGCYTRYCDGSTPTQWIPKRFAAT